MTRKGPIQRLVTYKDYAIEMVNLIIKETDLNPCGEHATEDLGASGLYDLSRVRTRRFQFDNSYVFIFTSVVIFYFRRWCG